MSADGSAAIPRESVPQALAVATLADVLRRLENHGDVEPRRRRELCSAVHTVCRVLGKEPASLPADLRHLRVLLAPITPAVAGVCAGRWANVRSLALKALKHAGIRAMPGRYRERHAPEWRYCGLAFPTATSRAASAAS